MYLGTLSTLFAILLSQKYFVVSILILFLAIIADGLAFFFSKIPEDTEDKSRAIKKAVLRAVLIGMAVVIVCMTVSCFLHPQIL